MQRVCLLGELGEKFGAEHQFYNLRSPAEAIKLLCINNPQLTEYLVTSHEQGIGYQVIQAGVDLGYPDLQLPFGERDLTIVPVVMGSKSFGQILAGVGLVALSFLLPGAGIFGATSIFGATATAGGFLTGLGTALSVTGASLILGGVAQLISPQPALPTLGGDLRFESGISGGSTPSSSSGPTALNRGTSGKQSYAYTGAANTVGIGATIPVAYGEVLIGSHLLSAKIDVTDDSDPITEVIGNPSFETVRVDGNILTYNFPASLVGTNSYRTRRATADDPGVGEFGDRRTPLNQALGLNKNDKAENDFDVYNAGRDKFTITYVVPNGIFDRVGEAGTTLTQGYFTYKVELILVANPQATQYVGQVYAAHQSTIQGLTPKSAYYWQSRFSLPQIPFGGQGGVWRLRTTIVDVSVSPSVTFQIKAVSFGG